MTTMKTEGSTTSVSVTAMVTTMATAPDGTNGTNGTNGTSTNGIHDEKKDDQGKGGGENMEVDVDVDMNNGTADATTPTKEDKDKDKKDKDKKIPKFILSPCILDFLERSPDKKFETDFDYFQALLAVESARILYHGMDESARKLFFQHVTVKTLYRLKEGNPIMRCKTVGEAAEELFRQLNVKLQNYIRDIQDEIQTSENENENKINANANVKHEEKKDEKAKDQNQAFVPLVEKFLHALKVNEVEKQIFRFILVASSSLIPHGIQGLKSTSFHLGGQRGRHGMNPYSAMTTTGTIHQYFGKSISLPEVMSLMSSEGIWVKEQLYYNNVESYPETNVSNLTGHTINALIGFDISLTQYQALTSSMLQKILLGHTPFRTSSVGESILKRKFMQEQGGKEIKMLKGAYMATSNPLANALSFRSQNKKGTEQNGGSGGSSMDVDSVGSSSSHNKKQRNGGKRERLFEALSMSIRAESKRVKKDQDVTVKKADDTIEKKDDNETSKTELQIKIDNEFGPYPSDLAYLEDQVRLMDFSIQLNNLKSQLEKHDNDDELDDVHTDEISMGTYQLPAKKTANTRLQQEKSFKKIERRITLLEAKICTKIKSSQKDNGKVFRLEQLCQALHLGSFEKFCIISLIKGLIMPQGRSARYGGGPLKMSVGTLIGSLCSSLEEKMKSRKFFYKSSILIMEGILTVSQRDFMTDLSMCMVELDRRLFDYIVGLDTEMSEMVNGSHLYLPDVSIDDVVLPKDTKDRIYDSVVNYEKVKDVIHDLGINKKITYGLGQVLLFYGKSGTGKTMLANALAAKLKMKVLLVNFPNLGTNSSGSIIKFLFREARINRALLFFDECESLFMSRDKVSQSSVNMILTELERFDGLCILATNRAYDLDEAMHRRISLAVEFRKPDHIMRQEIWKTLKPPELPIDDDVDFRLLANKFELVGGTVKNAWLQSIYLMVRRGGDKVTQKDLIQAASEQILGQLSMEDFDRRVIPTSGIDSMILVPSIKESLNSIVHYSKAQSVLFGQWGFDQIHRSTSGISVLFTGIPGTGKTMAAEAIGFDLGRPLLVVNVAELVSKYVGETGKNIDKVFAEAKKKDAVLCFDEAEGLFGGRASNNVNSVGRHDNLNVGLLLQYIENFSGICVVITNMKDAIDKAFFRRFRFVLDFEMPDAADRELIWKKTVPQKCPLAKDVDFSELARRYEMCGGSIKNALLRAATNAALRTGSDNAMTMEDLTKACTAEEQKQGMKHKMIGMYS